MQNINISKIAFGSLSTTIGDCTLGYTEDVSFRAREVDGIYVDNPPVLSRDYSSVIWKYYADTDNYMFTHVQGLHVTDSSMARFFPYRGAYEVSREEMNRVGMNVASVLDAMPRIHQFAKTEKWDKLTALHPHVASGNKQVAECLAELIERSADFGKRLYISIPSTGRDLRENNIFSTDEWHILMDALDILPLEMRRYASFAFCVDEHYADQIDDVLLIIYTRESGMVIPQNASDIKWEQIPSLKRASAEDLQPVRSAMKILPGGNSPLLSLTDMFSQVRMFKERPMYEERLKKDKRPIDSAQDVFNFIRDYKGRVDDSVLPLTVSSLDPVKKKHVIEQLCASPKRDALITEGLETLLSDKAASLGTDADAWYTFLGKLKDGDRLLETSIRLYMSRIRSWNKRDVSALCKSMVAYQKAHPRKATTPLFRLMVKTLNLEKEIKIKTEPKNPSNNMQDSRTNSLVSDSSEQDTKSFDELYADILRQEDHTKKKTQVMTALCAFVVGAILSGCIAYLALSNVNGQTSQASALLTPADSTDTIKLSVTPNDSAALVISRLDSTLNARLLNDSIDTTGVKEINVQIKLK